VNAPDILKYGHQTVLDAVSGLDEDTWMTPNLLGVWSIKDIVAHLASFEQVLVEVLRSFSEDVPTPTLDRFRSSSTFNDDEVTARQGRTASEVLHEYQQAALQVMELIGTVPEEARRRAGTLPWYGAGYSLDDLIVYAYYAHKREHCAQIKLLRKQLVKSG
jgi:uncharacterized damage-inducible protein DinB